jgi:glycosyltransferase involved in cell wall biosynthesis
MPKRVAIVLATYCPTEEVQRYFVRCLQSLAKHTRPELYHLIVVEQGPLTWRPFAKVKADYADYIYFPEPLGHAKAVNAGLALVPPDAEYVCLLSNDVFVCPEWLAILLEDFRKDSRLGLLAPFDQNSKAELDREVSAIINRQPLIHPAIEINENGLFYNWHWWACVLLRNLPGFRLDETFNFRYADQEADMWLHRHNYRIARTPRVIVEHVNSATYSQMHKEKEEAEERAEMIRRYGVPGFEDFILRERGAATTPPGAVIRSPLFSILHTSARPDKWRDIYEAWIEAAVYPEQIEYDICMDRRWGFDPVAEMRDPPSHPYLLRYVENVHPYNFSGYVSGVNTAANASTGRILIVNADDQYPCDRWDERILDCLLPKGRPIGELGGFLDYFKDKDFVLEVSTGTPEEHDRGIMVMPILSRARYERLGYVFYPEYESMFADNDFCEHARQDGVVIDARHLLFPHKHPIVTGEPMDEIYKAQNRKEAYQLGQSLLQARRASKFDNQAVILPSVNPAKDDRPVIAMCLSGDDFRGAWVDGIMDLQAHLIQRDFRIYRMREYVSNVYVTRENLRQAMQGLDPRPELVLWIDDDNVLTPAQFDRLYSDLEDHKELDGVTAWSWIHDDDKKHFMVSCGAFAPDRLHWNPFDSLTFPKESALKPCEVTGFPAFLMRWSAIEKAGGMPFLPFLDSSLPHGLCGEDIAFCRRAGDGGAVFMVDPRVRVPHLKYVEVNPVSAEDVEAKEQPKIAVMMRVKNEARWIARCIQSVKQLGPVYVMDDGSTDDTVAIVRRCLDSHEGGQILSPFIGQELNEARDKNYLLSVVNQQCHPDWIFCIDGDEELEPGSIEKIRRACQIGTADCYNVRFLYLWNSPDQARFDGVYSQLQRPSLFRAGKGLGFESSYKHTGIHCNFGLHVGNAPKFDQSQYAPLNVFLLHYGYMLKADRLKKYEFYNRIDPHNEIEDNYRHMVLGDLPELPASMKVKFGGPLDIRKLPSHLVREPIYAGVESTPLLEGADEPEQAQPPSQLKLITKGVRLNLGCSNRLEKGFWNVDIVKPADELADLSTPWPWADNSVDFIRAWDFIEHLPDPIFTMNEAFRVLKPGGQFDILVPTTEGRGAHQDPGHKSFWNRNSFFYYTHGDPHLERFKHGNGVKCRFRVIAESTERLPDDVVKLSILLEAVKEPMAAAAD